MIHSLSILPLSFHISAWDRQVEAICASWDGTPYMEGKHRRGVAVDCVHFGGEVLDSLYGTSKTRELTILRGDTCLHNGEAIRRAMAAFLRLYDADRLPEATTYTVEAGDILVVGPRFSGPGHLMIVGGASGRLWHATQRGVACTGYGVSETERLFAVYRPLHKDRWL